MSKLLALALCALAMLVIAVPAQAQLTRPNPVWEHGKYKPHPGPTTYRVSLAPHRPQ